jgi:hypothetical protein
MSKMVEPMSPTGKVVFRVIDANTDQVIKTIKKTNLVVRQGRQNISRLLGGDAAGYAITQFAVGTSATNPTMDDTVIPTVLTKAVEGVAYPGNDVQFTIVLETAEANDNDIAEWALINSNGDLVARVTPAVIVKTNSIRVEATWTIQF